MNTTTGCSVKVMRSFDYCHFEISLSISDDAMANISLDEVDQLRKAAARLADKAVEQYKVAKANFETCDSERRDHDFEERSMFLNAIRSKPEHERTPEEQARLKAHNDFRYRTRYDYQDDA